MKSAMEGETGIAGRQQRKLLVFCLDGYDIAFAEEMMAEGELPHMRKLHDSSVRFHLDHGRAKATGLAWEQFATGRAPGNGGRFSAIEFDPQAYRVRQTPTQMTPVFSELDAKLAVFDIPYFDLSLTRGIGMTSWGSHDPGVAAVARPSSLANEIKARFGSYCAQSWIYGFTWPSADRTRHAGHELAQAVRQRRDIARWLLCERLPDWDVALVGVSEAHSAIEQFWHGVDKDHPLHGIDSAKSAGEAVRAIYREIDALVGLLTTAMPDAGALAFSMHGMGRNQADVPAMALLPEFLFRLANGRPFAAQPCWTVQARDDAPLLRADQDWSAEVNALLPPIYNRGGIFARALNYLNPARTTSTDFGDLGWMPAARYQRWWRSMPAFAFPAFYDGQIRFNIKGREQEGIVAPEDFEGQRDLLVKELHRIRCGATGTPVVKDIWYPDSLPLQRSASEPDLYIEWNGSPVCFDHPDTGRIGPYPWRRTGGHTGERGFAWLQWPGLTGDIRWRSAFDVVPTIFHLMGQRPPAGISGVSLLDARAEADSSA